ncbi:glycosyltransferase 61 family protein [Nitrosomonas communis]|uniref:glycosyltransferase 61 family protein n=1 Tax=Nitrosomonas communis TaxID=44574 RepID=UPI003D2D75A2
MKIIYSQHFSISDYIEPSINNIGSATNHSLWITAAEGERARVHANEDLAHSVSVATDLVVWGGWGFLPHADADYFSKHHWSPNNVNLCTKQYSNVSSPQTTIDAEGIMLSWPGIYTYGHWIYDILPRIWLTKSLFTSGDISHLPVILPNNLNIRFYEIFDILDVRYIKANMNDGVLIRTAYIPSFTSHLFKYPAEFHIAAFDWVRQVIGVNQRGVGTCYIKHTPQTSHKNPITSSILEASKEVLERSQISHLDPAPLSFRDQIKHISNFSKLIGLDSSAMHNFIFMNRGAKQLILCNRYRINLLHACLSALQGAPLYVCEDLADTREVRFDINDVIAWSEN